MASSASVHEQCSPLRPLTGDSTTHAKTNMKDNTQARMKKDLCELAHNAWRVPMSPNNERPTSGFHREVTIDPFGTRHGERHAPYRLHIPDGSSWMAKLYNIAKDRNAISKSTEHDESLELQSDQVRLEAYTMIYVREYTKIPVPRVYAYDSDPNSERNILGTSYILMEYLEGQHDPFANHTQVKHCDIVRIHNQFVDFTWQLLSRRWGKVGRLDRRNRVEEMVDKTDQCHGPFASSTEYYTSLAHLARKQDQVVSASDNDPDNANRRESSELLAKAASYAGKGQFDGQFCLQHPQTDWKNLLFDKNFNIVGVLGWQWTHAVPIQSFKILPYNYSSRVQPEDEANMAHHLSIAEKEFSKLADQTQNKVHRNVAEALCCAPDMPHHQIARCIEDCDSPEARLRHFNRLQELVFTEELKDWQIQRNAILRLWLQLSSNRRVADGSLSCSWP